MEEQTTRTSERRKARPRALLHQYTQAISPASAVPVVCRGCSRAVRVPVEVFHAGTSVGCPHCGTVTDLKELAANVPQTLTPEWSGSRDRPVSEFP